MDELLARFPVVVFATVALPAPTSPTTCFRGVMGRGVAMSKKCVMAEMVVGDGTAAIIAMVGNHGLL